MEGDLKVEVSGDDETDYLPASPKSRERLLQSIAAAERGEFAKTLNAEELAAHSR